MSDWQNDEDSCRTILKWCEMLRGDLMANLNLEVELIQFTDQVKEKITEKQ